MGKVKMKNKRYALLINTVLLLSILISAISVQAATPRIVYGKVYINGVLAPNGTPVKITVPSQPDPFINYTYANGNYVINFIADNWEECTFSVYIQNAWRNPVPLILDVETEIEHTVNLNVDIPNSPPNIPSNPNPTNSATNVGINDDLSWTGGDPDVGDTVTYDVYFGMTTPPTTKVSANQSGTTYNPGTMNYNTPYYWKIVAWDNHGASTAGSVWSFTTGVYTPPYNPPGDTNKKPTANASASETTGSVGVSINFDGSESTDSDGTIVGYRWDFDGDGTYDTDWLTTATTTHIYTSTGNYTVVLQVKDNDGATDVDEIQVVVTAKPNLPPTAPVVSGVKKGHKNTDYDYTAVSTDADNDTLQYIFDWDDDTNSTTDFVANGTAATETHNWSTWGFYTIKVNASDNKTVSGTTSYVVLIDVHWVKNIGYLIDTDSDDTYELFYSNETGNETDVELLVNGSYLINSDEDSEWDYYYDPETDTLTPYIPGEEPEDNMIWYALVLGMIIVIIMLLIIAAAMKKKEKPKGKPKKPKK